MKNIKFQDTSLRDGEQTPGVAYSLQDKIIVAEQLIRLNVDSIELGFPAASKNEAEICKYLNMPTQKKILLFILEKKIVTSIQIRDHIKKSPSVVSVNLNELFKAKIINRKYDIPSNKFSLKKPQLLKAVLNEYYPDLTEKYWLRSSVNA